MKTLVLMSCITIGTLRLASLRKRHDTSNDKLVLTDNTNFCLFVWLEALRPSQQFFSRVGTFSWVEPVLSDEDEVSLFIY